MRVKMFHTQLASPEGWAVHQYDAGEEYEVPRWLGIDWLKKGHARSLEAPPQPTEEFMQDFLKRLRTFPTNPATMPRAVIFGHGDVA